MLGEPQKHLRVGFAGIELAGKVRVLGENFDDLSPAGTTSRWLIIQIRFEESSPLIL